MASELDTPNVDELDQAAAAVGGLGPLLRTREVAEMLQLHVNTVKRLGDLGDLPFYRVGRRGDRRFRLLGVTAYLERGGTSSGPRFALVRAALPGYSQPARTPIGMTAAPPTTPPGEPITAEADAPWMRWRRGERVCVVCGGSPSTSVDCPPPWLPPFNLASGAPAWKVPACERHARPSAWPMKTLLAICDEHGATQRD
jgi:excisionase family DNA binding protein